MVRVCLVLILSTAGGGTPFYTLQDGNYNVVGVTDDTGALRKQYTYDPYGQLIASESYGSVPDTQHGFQGLFFHRYDADTSNQMLVPDSPGIYYNRNRTYHPTLGRFLQRDPNATALAVLAVAAMNGGAPSAPIEAFGLLSLYGDGPNLYQFGSSNPVNRIDPLGLSSNFDYFEEGDAIITEIMGNRAATAAAVYDSIWKTFNTAQLLGELMISMLPGGDALILMSQLAKGKDVSLTDIMFAVASFAPGAGSAKVAFAALGAYADFSRGYRAVSKIKRGFSSFAALKRVLGPAGPGRQWHHIVEQSKIGQFGAHAIHNTDNVVPLLESVHRRISAHYSSKRAADGLTVRQWLSTKSFDEQYQYGLTILRKFGANVSDIGK